MGTRAFVIAGGHAALIANRNVRGFYEAAGFEVVGEQKTLLGPIALLMVKPVGPA